MTPESEQGSSNAENIKPKSSDQYPIHTSQELDAINRARANGKRFNGFTPKENLGKIAFEHEELAHRIELFESHENEEESGMDYLEALIRAQDSDAVIAQLYILGVLAPPPGSVSKNTAALGWIDFDDVIEKIGWSPRSTLQRREMHARLWQFIKFGDRAVIVGERSTPYVEPGTKKKIETAINIAIWKVTATKTVIQGELPFSDSVPVAAEIVVTPIIAALITNPLTAQFLPMGEVLGAIPGNKPSGAWARVIGLALASFWRRNPRRSLSGEFKPTRRELLEHYPPKVAPLDEILPTINNRRIIEYWCDALKILCETGILAREGEAIRTYQEIRAKLPLREWQEDWLDERVHLLPGEEMKAHIEGRAIAAAQYKPVKKKPKAFRSKKAS